MLEFINGLVGERDIDPNLGIIVDKKQTRETESQWLASQLVGIENGSTIDAVSEVDGRVVGNAEVRRGKSSDELHHGTLGISISKGYRDIGIGREMMRTLLDESKKAGLKTVELEVFANNPRAIRLYETVGFKQVGRIPKKIFRNGVFHDIIVMSIEL